MTAANEALSTDTPATVTFDTLSAAQELRKTGLEDRQAEAVVTTISKAMSETVATKADLQLVRSDFELLRSEFESLRQHVDSRLDALENRIIIKLGGLMVTMTFLLLAIGPFYIRWVLSLMGTS
jgi:hypothetical protein